MAFTVEDVEDVEFVDAVELISDGSTAYKSVSISSTSSIASTITISTSPPLNLDGFVYGDDPVEPGEKITITGSTGADGTYTIDTVVDNNNITVVEPIVNSTGGSGSIRRLPGAKLVGVDPTSLTNVSANDVQTALEHLDSSISAGGLTPATHDTLDQLVHAVAETGVVEDTFNVDGCLTTREIRTAASPAGVPIRRWSGFTFDVDGCIDGYTVTHFDQAGNIAQTLTVSRPAGVWTTTKV